MRIVYVADVGDGLAAGIHTPGCTKIQVDCGSQTRPAEAFQKGLVGINPDAFVLSHFHFDHYNGLLQSHQAPSWSAGRINTVCFPRLPKFPDNTNLLQAILAMNRWMAGDTTGSMEADFLSLLGRMTTNKLRRKPLSLGDTVCIQDATLEVLWPPRTIDDDNTLKVVRSAISAFEEALEADENLRRIHESIIEQGAINPFTLQDEIRHEPDSPRRPVNELNRLALPVAKGKVPEVVSRANKALRRAANHLSLAFHEGNKLLFLGDLEGYEITRVVKELGKTHQEWFGVIISPHHGTHWHKDLLHLRARWVVSSIGERLFRNVRPEFRFIGGTCLFTYLHGDITVPMCGACWFHSLPYARWL